MEEKVFALLRENREEYLSGEEIARRLAVSRTAVWKAIEELRREGAGIEFSFPPTVQEGSLFSTSSPAFIACRLLDRSHSDWHEMVPQKMLNITHYQRNANKNT